MVQAVLNLKVLSSMDTPLFELNGRAAPKWTRRLGFSRRSRVNVGPEISVSAIQLRFHQSEQGLLQMTVYHDTQTPGLDGGSPSAVCVSCALLGHSSLRLIETNGSSARYHLPHRAPTGRHCVLRKGQ